MHVSASGDKKPGMSVKDVLESVGHTKLNGSPEKGISWPKSWKRWMWNLVERHSLHTKLSWRSQNDIILLGSREGPNPRSYPETTRREVWDSETRQDLWRQRLNLSLAAPSLRDTWSPQWLEEAWAGGEGGGSTTWWQLGFRLLPPQLQFGFYLFEHISAAWFRAWTWDLCLISLVESQELHGAILPCLEREVSQALSRSSTHAAACLPHPAS